MDILLCSIIKYRSVQSSGWLCYCVLLFALTDKTRLHVALNSCRQLVCRKHLAVNLSHVISNCLHTVGPFCLNRKGATNPKVDYASGLK